MEGLEGVMEGLLSGTWCCRLRQLTRNYGGISRLRAAAPHRQVTRGMERLQATY